MNQMPSEVQPSGSTKSLAMLSTRAVVGVEAVAVTVEVHLANGLPSFSTVGLPETAVKESKDRVRGAILNSGFEFPAKRITVNLAPADLPKSGGRFDLPIALGILLASGQLPGARIEGSEFIGELALDGGLRKVPGVLPTALACGRARHRLFLPRVNAAEASLAEHTESLPAAHLLELCAHLTGQQRLVPALCEKHAESELSNGLDLSDVRGQLHAKRALEIAAAGNHSLLFVGPPGTGKSMLASRLPTLLPAMQSDEALQAAAIQSVANGEFVISDWRRRPYRAPHHSASAAALVGGGSVPRPGEISRAHHGVLFLDELTEFSRSTLEQLREPLETGEVNIARASHSVCYPAKFLLVAACNPCKCGFLGDGTDRCQCTAASIEQYRGKLSGPLIDRIDMHLHLPRVSIKELQSNQERGESSSQIRARVDEVRARQRSRQGCLNSQFTSLQLERYCALDAEAAGFLEVVCERLNMSARAYHRILKLARTIADMNRDAEISKVHLSEAIGFRCLDRN
ncbi:ATP-dependent protease [Arenicella chitinivorans]|uniref:ATP-dependent protease n=1 Tax=Arenicella chitinivorans TaxID=1329800 RepID=A0A918VIQ4_9GAMM|nr:YifB family Mg chelatase-like AAA ATPase [Arenicella chitinivorans]GGZ99705.1 ATP-dependent protease [Arenicella chitinivorans]